MVWSGRARSWCAVAVCVVLPVACSSRTRTVGADAADGGGGHTASGATGGAATGAAPTSAGGTPSTAGQPTLGGAGLSGGSAHGGSPSGSAGESGSAGAGSGEDDAGQGGDAALGGRSGSPGDSEAGANTAGDGGTSSCDGPCVCEGWWADCDGVRGCETPLDGPENCGACGRVATVYEHTRTICSSAGGDAPICEPGFGDCDLTELDCETTFGDAPPSCLPVYLGSLELDPRISVAAIRLGRNGEIYLGGTFSGAADFDPGPASDVPSAVAHYSGFLTQLAADGSYLWTRVFGGSNEAEAWVHDITQAPDGSVLLLGTSAGSIDLDPSAQSDMHTGESAAFVVALSEDGEYRFGRSLVSAEALDWGSRLSTSESGEIYALMGSERLLAGGGSELGFRLTKLDAAGQPLWSRAAHGPECMALPSAVVATAEGVAALGNVEGRCDLDGFPDQVASRNPARAAGLLALFDANAGGSRFGFFQGEDDVSLSSVNRALPAGDGAMLIAGLFEGKSDLDPGPSTASRGVAANDVSSYIVRLDGAGQFVWARTLPSFGYEDMAVAGDGSAFLIGYPVGGGTLQILAFAPDSRSRFALEFAVNTTLGPIAANTRQLVVVGHASGGGDIDPTNGVDVSLGDRQFVARFALSAE